LALARLTGDAHRARLAQCHAEAATPLERIQCALALAVASGNKFEQPVFERLRTDLGIESYLYKRQVREDIVSELSRSSAEDARQLADCWAKVYKTMPGY